MAITNQMRAIKKAFEEGAPLTIYFVLVGNEYTTEDVAKARGSIRELSFYEPLAILTNFIGLDKLESK